MPVVWFARVINWRFRSVAKSANKIRGLLVFVNSEIIVTGSIKVSGKLPTYPSPKPSFCPKWDNVGFGEGQVVSYPETLNWSDVFATPLGSFNLLFHSSVRGTFSEIIEICHHFVVYSLQEVLSILRNCPSEVRLLIQRPQVSSHPPYPGYRGGSDRASVDSYGSYSSMSSIF